MTKTKIKKTLSSVGSRFFGIEMKQGGRINAQLIKETPCYVTVKDIHAQEPRKISKSSIKKLSFAGQTIS